MKLFINENAQENKYQLLGRLVSDCKYYLGGGYGAEKHLWAKSVEDQIAKMKEIYNSLDVKPEWLTMQDIEHYEKEMKKVKLGKNESLYTAKTIKEQKADIEVENPGILEVPEGKNVEDLPIKHFVDIANRKGLSTVTRALNNLQVWNKNKNKSLSKWAGNMIDKVSKRFENQKNESLNRLNEATLPDWQDTIIKEVYNVLENNRIYAEVYDDNDFSGDNSFLLCVEINDGDWKHEHRRVDIIISNLLDNYDNIDITNMGEETIGDSDSDTYSSIHKYMIIRNESNTEECYTTENTITEFSSNFDGTEFDEVEFYSDDLKDVPKQTISNRIEALCSFPINIYDIEIDTMGTLIISYEVKEEDYNPNVIEATIIDILEGMEDNIRASRPVRAESISKKYVKAMRNRKLVKEDYDIDFDAITIPEDERYEYIKSKDVSDNGWRTEYTMYYDWEDDKYIFIFGDSDLYDPTNTEPDWECDTEAEANDWFANYEGYDEEDLDESITESTGKSYWKYNQFEDTLADGDYYDKHTIKRFRLIPCNTSEECYDGDIKRFSAWAVCESEYPYKEVYCTKDEAYNYLMDFLNNGRYEQIHNL